jgi:hypothetical protein
LSINGIKLRAPAVFKSLLGFGFIVLLCMLTYRIHPDKFDAGDTYTASIFGASFATDRIIQPDEAMYALERRNTGVFSDSSYNLSASYRKGASTKSIRRGQFRFEKTVLDDAYQTGTQFFAIDKRTASRLAANNTFKRAARIESNGIKLKDSPCKSELHGQGGKSRKTHSIIREGKSCASESQRIMVVLSSKNK